MKSKQAPPADAISNELLTAAAKVARTLLRQPGVTKVQLVKIYDEPLQVPLYRIIAIVNRRTAKQYLDWLVNPFPVTVDEEYYDQPWERPCSPKEAACRILGINIHPDDCDFRTMEEFFTEAVGLKGRYEGNWRWDDTLDIIPLARDWPKYASQLDTLELHDEDFHFHNPHCTWQQATQVYMTYSRIYRKFIPRR